MDFAFHNCFNKASQKLPRSILEPLRVDLKGSEPDFLGDLAVFCWLIKHTKNKGSQKP